MEDYTQPLTRQQIKDLAVAAIAFMFDMKERHPEVETSPLITSDGVYIRFGSNMEVRLHHGRFAYQTLYTAAGRLDLLCKENNWEPRFLLPEWAQFKSNEA